MLHKHYYTKRPGEQKQIWKRIASGLSDFDVTAIFPPSYLLKLLPFT